MHPITEYTGRMATDGTWEIEPKPTNEATLANLGEELGGSVKIRIRKDALDFPPTPETDGHRAAIEAATAKKERISIRVKLPHPPNVRQLEKTATGYRPVYKWADIGTGGKGFSMRQANYLLRRWPSMLEAVE